MAGQTSKTARRSSPQLGKNATPEQVVAASAGSGVSRLIPLNGGKHCYFSDPRDGRTRHLRTDSDEFVALYIELADLGLDKKLAEEVDAFCAAYPDSAWPKVAASIAAARNGEVAEAS